MDGCIQIKPEDEISGTGPSIDSIGGMCVDEIDPNSGYTDGPCLTMYGSWLAEDSPFGGPIAIRGRIPCLSDFPNDISCVVYPRPEIRYKLEYSRYDPNGVWEDWKDMNPKDGGSGPGDPYKFLVKVQKSFGSIILCESIYSEWQDVWNECDPNGFYSYYQDSNGPITQEMNDPKTLMLWDTDNGKLEAGLYKIRLVIKTATGLTPTDPLKIVLDNTLPYVSIIPDPNSLGICAQVDLGTTIEGTYTLLDQHLKYYRLRYSCGASCGTPAKTIIYGDYNMGDIIENGSTITIQPAAPPWPLPPSTYDAKAPTFEALGRNGESYSFIADPNIFVPCGYAIYLKAWDRTIYHNHSGWHRWKQTSEHFCLLREEEEEEDNSTNSNSSNNSSNNWNSFNLMFKSINYYNNYNNRLNRFGSFSYIYPGYGSLFLPNGYPVWGNLFNPILTDNSRTSTSFYNSRFFALPQYWDYTWLYKNIAPYWII